MRLPQANTYTSIPLPAVLRRYQLLWDWDETSRVSVTRITMYESLLKQRAWGMADGAVAVSVVAVSRTPCRWGLVDMGIGGGGGGGAAGRGAAGAGGAAPPSAAWPRAAETAGILVRCAWQTAAGASQRERSIEASTCVEAAHAPSNESIIHQQPTHPPIHPPT